MVRTLAKEKGIPIEEAVKRWERAKMIATDQTDLIEEDGDEYWRYVAGVFKKSMGVKDGEMIAESALQEDVDAVGLSILSGAHMALVPRIMELLRGNGQVHVKVFLGGIIPDEDVPRLREMGVTGVYGPGTPTDQIIQDVRQAVPAEPLA